METKNDWENNNAEKNQSYIDNRTTDLFKPMSDSDYIDRGPKKPMTVERLFVGVFGVVVSVIVVLFIIFVFLILGWTRESEKTKKEKEATAKETLRSFLCDKCGLAEDSYRIVKSDSWTITFEIGDASYILRDGNCSNYYAEQFREKLRTDLTEKLAASDLLAEIPFELLNVDFECSVKNRGTEEGLLPLAMTPDTWDGFLRGETGEESPESKRLEISCEIKIFQTGDYRISAEEFSVIRDAVPYLECLTVQAYLDENGDGTKKQFLRKYKWKGEVLTTYE